MKIKRSILHALTVVAGLGYLPQTAAQVQVTIDGQVAIPAGQAKVIEYLPAARRLVVRSIHDDIRCAAVEPVPVGAEDFKLVLDQVNTETEPEAIYRVSDTDGIVEVNLADNVLAIHTTDTTDATKGDQQLDCAPFRESFWESDFDNLVVLASDAPEFVAAGATFSITLTVTNSSKSIVATNVEVVLDSSIAPDGFNLLNEALAPEITGDIWTIASLWPRQSVSLEVTYTAPLDGSGVTLEIVDVTADNRAGTAPLATGNPSLLTVVDTGT